MKRTLTAPLALAAALMLSGAAIAQTTVNGMEVSAEDLPKVQAQCDALNAATLASPGTDTPETSGEASDTPDETPETTDPAASNADGALGIDEAVTTYPLDTLTLDQCKEAGLIM